MLSSSLAAFPHHPKGSSPRALRLFLRRCPSPVIIPFLHKFLRLPLTLIDKPSRSSPFPKPHLNRLNLCIDSAFHKCAAAQTSQAIAQIPQLCFFCLLPRTTFCRCMGFTLSPVMRLQGCLQFLKLQTKEEKGNHACGATQS